MQWDVDQMRSNSNPLGSNSKLQISCELQPTQAQGSRAKGDQSPKAGGDSGVEGEIDLARDGSAGVRKSHERGGDVIVNEDVTWVDERWRVKWGG